MLETLTTTNEQVEQAEPISAHPGKLKDQLVENEVCRQFGFNVVVL